MVTLGPVWYADRHPEPEMNRNTVEGTWKQFKGRIRMQWGKLTRRQSEVIAGKRVVSAGQAQRAFGVSSQAEARKTRSFDVARKGNRQ